MRGRLALFALGLFPVVAHAQDIGATAPDFSAPYVADSAAAPWHFADRGKAPLTLLYFWATWCRPCEAFHPWLEAFAREYESRGVKVVTIDMREPADSIRRLLAPDTLSVTLDVLDPDGHISDLYSVTSVPTTVLVAANNIVLRRWEGVTAATAGIKPVVDRVLTPSSTASSSRYNCAEP